MAQSFIVSCCIVILHIYRTSYIALNWIESIKIEFYLKGSYQTDGTLMCITEKQLLTQLLFQVFICNKMQFLLKHSLSSSLYVPLSFWPSGCWYSFTLNSDLWHWHSHPIKDVFTKTTTVTLSLLFLNGSVWNFRGLCGCLRGTFILKLSQFFPVSITGFQWLLSGYC